MPIVAMEHLTVLSVQVAYATDNLLRAIFSHILHVEDLTIMVLMPPAYLHMSLPNDAYTAYVSAFL
jgi:hypothetical protein